MKKIQRSCLECRKWKDVPSVPRMADLPVSRLHLYKPPFWLTDMDCFGPLSINIGRRHEKRWGIIFACQMTWCLHLELLSAMDTDSILLAL